MNQSLYLDVAASKRQGWLAAGGFVLIALFILALPVLEFASHSNIREALRHAVFIEIYNRTVISTNYFQDGFVRRGLSGTITSLFSSSWTLSTLFFVGLSSISLILALSAVIRRLAVRTSYQIALYLSTVLALSPQAFWGWSLDPVRTDMLVATSVTVCVVMWLGGHRAAAVTSLLAGLLVHETAIVFGAPLLILMMWHDQRSSLIDLRQSLLFTMLLVIGVIVLLVSQHFYSAPSDIIASHMRSRSPPDLSSNSDHLLWRDIAIYMSVSGSRGLMTAVCSNLEMNPQYWFMGCAAFAVIWAHLYITRIGNYSLLSFCLVGIPPLIFMLLVANDTGRWLKLSALNIWLLQSFLLLRAPVLPMLTRRRAAIGLSLLAALVWMGPSRYFYVNDAAHALALRTGFADPPPLGLWMDRCASGWRADVYGRATLGEAP